MTKLTPEILKEAVGYAEGWEFRTLEGYRGTSGSKDILAALASQLISQVDAMAPDATFSSDFSKCALIYSESRDDDWHAGDCKNPSATNRDENSIIACVEFFRRLKDG